MLRFGQVRGNNAKLISVNQSSKHLFTSTVMNKSPKFISCLIINYISESHHSEIFWRSLQKIEWEKEPQDIFINSIPSMTRVKCSCSTNQNGLFPPPSTKTQSNVSFLFLCSSLSLSLHSFWPGYCYGKVWTSIKPLPKNNIHNLLTSSSTVLLTFSSSLEDRLCACDPGLGLCSTNVFSSCHALVPWAHEHAWLSSLFLVQMPLLFSPTQPVHCIQFASPSPVFSSRDASEKDKEARRKRWTKSRQWQD